MPPRDGVRSAGLGVGNRSPAIDPAWGTTTGAASGSPTTERREAGQVLPPDGTGGSQMGAGRRDVALNLGQFLWFVDPVIIRDRMEDAERRQPDSNRRSGFCRPLPYHLAMAPCCSISFYHPDRIASLFMDGTDRVNRQGESARDRLFAAIDDRQDELVATIAELVREPSILGNEAGVQAIVARHLAGAGMRVESYDLPEDTPQQPNGGISGVPFAGRQNVHGYRIGSGGGRSLILNGH